MKLYRLFLCVLVFAGAGSAYPEDDNCIACHYEFEEANGPSHKFSQDIHFQNGLGCADCHGGHATLDDMDEVRDMRGYEGVPSHSQVPEFCARCHSDATYMHEHNPALPTDQLAKYKTSVHGKRLYNENDGKVANCISCHTVHEIGDGKLPHSSTHPLNLPGTCGKCHADPEYMAGYDIPVDQLSKFEQSVHGQALLGKKDLGAPACNDCHGNHGASPPGVASLSAVCGNCHSLESELFDKSPHKEAFDENDFPMCETCHSNHLIEKPTHAMLDTQESAICLDCHDIEDGTRGLTVADSMFAAINQLVTARRNAEQMLNEAIAKGMLTTDEEIRMKEVDQTLINARTLVHSFDSEPVASKAMVGTHIADTIKVNSANLIDDYQFRRKGLAWATLFIAIVAIALYLKIRRLD